MSLQGYRADVPHADYRGLVVPADDARAAAIKAEADREVGRLAERFGLQPEATLARFSAETVSVGLGRDYRAEELAERAADRAARGQPAERVDEAAAQLADFHRRAGAIYREAAERLRDLEREDPRGEPEIGPAHDRARSRGQPQREEGRPVGRPILVRATWRPTVATRRTRGASRPARPLAVSATTTSGAGDDAARTGHPARRRCRAHGRHPARPAGRRRGASPGASAATCARSTS